MTTNYEKIKNMSIEDMATTLKLEQCKECGYCASCWEDCEQEDCWNFTNEHYKQFLQQEAQDEFFQAECINGETDTPQECDVTKCEFNVKDTQGCFLAGCVPKGYKTITNFKCKHNPNCYYKQKTFWKIKCCEADAKIEELVEQLHSQQKTIKIKPGDVEVSTYPEYTGGMKVDISHGIKVKDLKTGIIICCDTERSQLDNKEKVFAFLEARTQQKTFTLEDIKIKFKEILKSQEPKTDFESAILGCGTSFINNLLAEFEKAVG